jgi:nucleotide-binding universal stress UspA family protein
MKHILLTTDFSEESKRAFARTADFARRLQLGIKLVHVIVDFLATPHGAPLAPPLSNPGVTEEIAKTSSKLTELACDFEDIEIETEVLSGEHVAQTVAEHARDSACEFIAISTHGSSGLRHLFLGSVAEELLRHATVPVLAFPREN